MKTVTFLRHAQSLGNLGYITIDPPLSRLGIYQASKLYGHYDLIILSELRRTHQTLENSNITSNHIIISPLVNEIIYGHVTECTNYHVISGKCIKETDEELADRTQKFEMLLDKFWDNYNNILVISHSGFIRAFTRDSKYLNNAESITFETVT